MELQLSGIGHQSGFQYQVVDDDEDDDEDSNSNDNNNNDNNTQGRHQKKTKTKRKISDKCQITSYPLPPQPNNDKLNSDKKLEV